MTIKEAENQYFQEIKKYEDMLAVKKKRVLIISSVICGLLAIIGIILLICGLTAPKETLYGGYEMETHSATVQKAFGIVLIISSPLAALLTVWFMYLLKRKWKFEFLTPIIRNLYSNYIRSTDINEKDKVIYEQKLEDLRSPYSLINTLNSEVSILSDSYQENK